MAKKQKLPSVDQMVEMVRQQDEEFKAMLREMTDRHDAECCNMMRQIQDDDTAMKADLNAALERWQDEQRRLLEQLRPHGE